MIVIIVVNGIHLGIAVAFPQSGSSSTIFHRIGILKCWFLWRELNINMIVKIVVSSAGGR